MTEGKPLHTYNAPQADAHEPSGQIVRVDIAGCRLAFAAALNCSSTVSTTRISPTRALRTHPSTGTRVMMSQRCNEAGVTAPALSSWPLCRNRADQAFKYALLDLRRGTHCSRCLRGRRACARDEPVLISRNPILDCQSGAPVILKLYGNIFLTFTLLI